MKQLIIICADTSKEELLADYLSLSRRRRWQRNKEKRHRRYLMKQRLLGAGILILTGLVVLVLDCDATFGIITVPLGIGLIASKDMLLVNRYYWERKEESGDTL